LMRGSPIQTYCHDDAPINLNRPHCPHESPPQGESCNILTGLGCLDAGSSQGVMTKAHNG
jgi:hypothetical protein